MIVSGHRSLRAGIFETPQKPHPKSVLARKHQTTLITLTALLFDTGRQKAPTIAWVQSLDFEVGKAVASPALEGYSIQAGVVGVSPKMEVLK